MFLRSGRSICLWMALCSVTFAGGCFRAGERKSLSSEHPSLKIPAIVEAVESGEMSSAAHLIDDLDSDDPAVRLYAIEGLERLTGESFGYRYYDDPTARAAAVERWRAWLDQQARQ